MIIIGIENCKTCKDLIARHPDYRYVELSRNSSFSTGDILKAKILIGKIGLDTFPIVSDDIFEQVISLEEVDSEFKEQHPKLF